MKAAKMFTAAAAAAMIMGSAVAVVPAAQASELPAEIQDLQVRESTSTPIQLNYGGTAYVHTSESGTSVYATFEPAYDSRQYAKMTIQRYNPSEGWVDLQTKNGGLANYGFNIAKKNANVEFTNISKFDLSHRIKVQLYNESSYTTLLQTAYSTGWLRNLPMAPDVPELEIPAE